MNGRSAGVLVRVCPQTCEWIQGVAGATMRISFGCESALAPLR